MFGGAGGVAANPAAFGSPQPAPTVFGSPAAPSQTTVGFGSPGPNPALGGAQVASPVFGGSQTQQAGSPFGVPATQPTNPNATAFGAATNPSPGAPFGSQPLPAAFSSSTASASVFGGATANQGQAVTQAAAASPATSQSTNPLYTPLDKLTPEELAQFKADKFELGKIPIHPPPMELLWYTCNSVLVGVQYVCAWFHVTPSLYEHLWYCKQIVLDVSSALELSPGALLWICYGIAYSIYYSWGLCKIYNYWNTFA